MPSAEDARASIRASTLEELRAAEECRRWKQWLTSFYVNDQRSRVQERRLERLAGAAEVRRRELTERVEALWRVVLLHAQCDELRAEVEELAAGEAR